MAVHFILGGSGRGKSYYLNHMLIEQAEREPEREFIVVVPEQFTMQIQKELVEISGQRGIMNIDVQSFIRLAYRIFGETGAGNVPVLDDMGKTMVLRKVLENQKERLGYFGGSIHKKGYIGEIKSFLSELLQYDVSQEELGRMIQAAEKKPLLQKKLQDMEIVYQAFRDYLRDHYITSEEVLGVFCDVVQDSGILAGAVLCLDGFTGFTPVQYRLIRQLIPCCKELYISITMDPREELIRVGAPHRLFYMSRKTMHRIRELAEQAGVEVCPIIWTGKKLEETRYLQSPGLAFLEQNLFRYPAAVYPQPPQDISLHLLRQPEQEVGFVVEQVLALRRQKGVHYRDIAVVTGDLEVYGILAQESFERMGLPYFIDRKKSILFHPMVQMLRSLVEILRKDFAYPAVIAFLRGRYSPIAQEDVDLLDNFLLASGLRGYSSWQRQWKWERQKGGQGEKAEERLNAIRLQVLEQLDGIYQTIGRGSHSVEEYARAFCSFLEEQEFYAALLQDAGRFREEGQLSLAREYEQVYEIVLGVFDRLVELLGREEMKLGEFRELLETGFSEARLGLIPPGVDQIVVGDISRTRLSRVKYLFFLGTNDCNIPKGGGGGGILSESERSFLSEQEFELAPSSREVIFTEQFYLYLNLTKPERHLYLCYCETGNDGRAQNPAYVVERVRKLFPELKVTVEEQRQEPAHLLADDMGKKRLIQGMRRREYNNSQWKELYRYHLTCPEGATETGRLLQAAYYREQKSCISQAAARALYQDIIYGSASQLERYASCPFAYFLQYGLRLREREERRVEFFDIGNIVHEALEMYTKELLAQGKKWQDLTEGEQKERADRCLDQAVEEYKNGLLYDTERDTHMVTRMRQVLHRTIWAITAQMAQGEFETIESELSFQHLYGPVKLTGRVDRIDRASTEQEDYITVIDYKTGQKELSLSDLYYGLQMQLVIYLKAVLDRGREEMQGRQAGERKLVAPAGMLYYNISDPVLEGKLPEERRERALLEALRLQGLLNENDPVLPYIDRDFRTETGQLPPSATSFVAAFATDKNGMLKKNSATVTGEELEQLMEFTRQKVEAMGREILEGNTAVEPYRKMDSARTSACDYCPYHGVCRFDTRLEGNHYRVLKKMALDDALGRIQKELSQGELSQGDFSQED